MTFLLKTLGALLLFGSLSASVLSQSAQPKKPSALTKKAGSAAQNSPAGKKQTPKRSPGGPTASKTKPKTAPTPKPADPAIEKAKFEEALAAATPTEKAERLVRFLAEFPRSDNKLRAQESLAGARAAMADERLTAGETEQGLKLFKLAIDDAPRPYSDRLFSEIIATIPDNLYWRGQQTAAVETARSIESYVSTNQKQLLTLANFYLGTENGSEAKRIAEAAIKLDEANPAGHQLLGMAHRLNFELEEAERSFAKAAELDAGSAGAKRMLAEMKRSLGKPEEAEAIYLDLLAKDENDVSSRTGLTLALFEAGKKTDAEAELAKAIERSTANVFLLAGAAYWYAAHGDGEKAVTYARQAIEKDPRFIWSHIALARGLMLQRRPVDAEQVLVGARKYGNFPTLQYEIASARLASGFFREAAEELAKSFTADADGIRSRLGGRIERSAKTFTDLVSAERRASIFAPAAADSPESAEQLRALVEFTKLISANEPDEAAAVAAAERFVSGTDAMAVHRRLFAARSLLNKKIAPQKALEYARSATGEVDAALNVEQPAAAIMASELYEARETAFFKGDFLLIPDVPKQTLSAILRGRIEESAGLALLQTGNAAEATIRFRRALTVLPKDSAWWRSATWNLGSSLEAEGKNDEALKTYISSYKIDKPDLSRYIVISSLYKKVNGSIDGLEDEIGMSPLSAAVAAEMAAKPEPVIAGEKPSETNEAKAITPEPSPTPKAAEVIAVPEATPDQAADAKPTPSPESTPKPEETPAAATPSPSSELTPKPAETPAAATPSPSPESTPKAEETPTAALPSPSPSPEATQTPSAEPTPKPEETPAPLPERSVPATDPAPSSSPALENVHELKKESDKPESAGRNEIEPSKSEPAKPADSASPKPLFETIVIQVPRPTAKAEAEKPAEKKNADETPQEKPTDKIEVSDESIAAGSSRPRLVDGKEITGGEIPPCTIDVSQETISLINNGGNIAVLVAVSDGADLKQVAARSSSVKDVEIRLEPDIVGITGRSLYVIRSISPNTGMYQVSFELPCGKTTVNVRVR